MYSQRDRTPNFVEELQKKTEYYCLALRKILFHLQKQKDQDFMKQTRALLQSLERA